MIHRMDPPAPVGDGHEREPMPERIVPMLADAGRLPADESALVSFEVKWDGVRAIAYCKPGRHPPGEPQPQRDHRRLSRRSAGSCRDLGMREAVLDGEIVAFDDAGKPSFERLQSRMHVTSPNAVQRLSKSTPVVYAIFDLLYLDGETLMALPYEQRRERLEALGLGGPAWRVPAAQRGAGDAAARGDRAAGAGGGRRQAPGLPLRAGPADGRLDQDQAHCAARSW